MNLGYFALRCLYVAVFIRHTSTAQYSMTCNDTTNLTLQVENTIVTAVYPEPATLSAYVNYPKAKVKVYYSTNSGTRNSVSDPAFGDPCRYETRYIGANYNTYGLNITVTFYAKDSATSLEVSNVTVLLVQVAAVVSLQDSSPIYIEEKEKYLLNCFAFGNPPPTLWWNLTDRGINVEQRKIFEAVPQYESDISSITTLTIGSAYGALHNDSGTYTCQGNNTLSADNTTHKDSASVQISVHIPVEFINSSGIIQIKEGSSTSISCEFRGFPDPRFTWFNNTAYDSRNDSYDDIFYLSTLYIVESKCDDERNYTCFAENMILGDDQRNASGYVNVNFIDPPPITDLTVDSDQCNGTSMSITWTLIDDWKTSLTYEITYISDSKSTVVQTGNNHYIVNTIPDEEYGINVTAISECNKRSNVTSTQIRTGIYLPSEPVDVSATQTEDTKCTLEWNLPNITYNNISQYYIYYHSCIRGSVCEEYDTTYTTCENLVCTINMEETNSQYYFEVAAQNCAGIGPSEKSVGSCSTDTAAPTNVTAIELDDFEINPSGTTEVSESGFEVTIPEQSQQDGTISCYYIVMVRYGDLYNTSDQVRDRITIDPSNLNAIANASVQDVPDRQAYFAIASKSSSTVFIGDDTMSSCNGITRSLSNENYSAWNRNLTENRSYDMFILTTVPSVKDENKMYSQSSKATFLNVIIPETPAIPEPPTDVLIAAIVVPIIVVVLILTGLSIWYYKTKYKGKKNHNRYVGNAGEETLPMSTSPGRTDHLNDVSGADQPNTSRGYSQTRTSKIATAPPKPIMQPSYENIGLSFEPDAVSSPTFVPFGNLHQTYIARRKNNDRLFSEEFKAIPTEIVDSSITSDVANLPENTKKNRYKNIKTYDKSRVILSLLPNEPNSDYMNASYIHGFSAKNKFIATQGPKSNTVKDFWRMVFEQRCLSIVMLTNIIEKGKNKCVQYWPDVVSGTKDFDCYSVDFLDEIISVDYVTRRFTLRDNANPDKYYTVTQYHFTTWPDHGVPNTTTGMLRFYHRVMKENPTDSGPILVHCSAGVGRTGTFIGIDILTEQMNVLSGADFVKCIYDMRSQRPQMVQSMDQYMFLYKIIVDLHLYGDTEIALPKLHSEIERLERADPKNPRKNGFDVQYERINKVKTEIGETKAAEQSVNKRCNRNPRIIPYDHNRVFLMDPKLGEAVYINASVVKGYKRKDAFVTTQAPLNNTAENFWQMISDYCVSTIVTLNTFAEASMDPLFAYWPESDSSLDFGKFVVTSEGQEEFHGSFCKRNLQVLAKYRKHGNRNVVQYHYLAWEPRRAPKDRTALLEMIAQISRHQQGNGNPPIVVQCSDGSGRSGTFCAIMTLIQCVQIENIVDVFQTVRQLREERIGMVDSMEQYRFCYEIIEDYIKSFDVYSNFNFVESKEV